MEEPAQGGSSLKAGASAQAAGGGPGAGRCPQPLPLPPSEEERREGLVELHTSFRELVTFFCTNATIHGTIRLVCSSQNRLKTATWALLLAGALSALYWQFGLLFQQYWRYPVVMAVSVHSERKLFPSVTLCDMNPHRPRPARRHLRALDDFARENIYSLYGFNFTESEEDPGAEALGSEPAFQLDRGIRLQRLSPLGGQNRVGFRLCNRTGGDCVHRAYSSGVTAAQEWYRFHYVNILALLPNAPEDSHRSHGGHLVSSCRYDGQDCQAGHFQTSHHPTYGSCYTFHGIWAAQHPGITHGISLVLRAELQDHLPLLFTEAGIKVLIHRHDQTPFLEHQGFSIRPGTETTIGIREDEVHRLGSPYGHCTHSAGSVDVRLLYKASYTKQACLVSCFQQLMVDTCSCGYYLYPLPAGAEYCSYTRHPAWGHCFYRLYQDLETHRLPCTSRCPRPCRESTYKLTAGVSRWPSSKSADWIPAVLDRPGGRQSPSPRSRLAKVNIFYRELNYRTVDEMPVYSVPQLLSAMGSLWSLWFGSSVLSVLEVLELLLDAMVLTLLLCCRQLHRARGQLGAAPGEPTPSQRPTCCPAAAGMTSNARGPSWPRFP